MALKVPSNPSLAGLAIYQPGRPIEEVAREFGLDPSSLIKVASNENPLGPSPLALKAMQEEAAEMHLYPDGKSFHLKKSLCHHLGIQPSNLILGNGSNEIIEFLGHAFLGPGTNIVVSQYGFAIYTIVARMMGADVITVPAKDFGHDLKAMRDKTGMFAGDPVALRERYLAGIHRIPRRIARFDKPLIAAINGPAIGAGGSAAESAEHEWQEAVRAGTCHCGCGVDLGFSQAGACRLPSGLNQGRQLRPPAPVTARVQQGMPASPEP